MEKAKALLGQCVALMDGVIEQRDKQLADKDKVIAALWRLLVMWEKKIGKVPDVSKVYPRDLEYRKAYKESVTVEQFTEKLLGGKDV